MAVFVVLALLSQRLGSGHPTPRGAVLSSRSSSAGNSRAINPLPSGHAARVFIARHLVSEWQHVAGKAFNEVLPMAHPRTRSISTRVTADEYAACERWAGTRSVGLWLHDVLRATLTSAPARDLIVVGEVLGLRMIVLTLHHDMARGERPTDERVHDIIATADREKLRMAKARLAEPFLR